MFKPPKPPKPHTQESDLFDLIAPLQIWAINMYHATATKEQKRVDTSELTIRFIWDDVIVTHEKPEYFDNVITKLPKLHSLFSTTFRNNTDSEQEYNFRTERCTRSMAEIEITKGVVIAKEISLKLALPGELLEANAGFKHELSLGSANRQSTEEELAWGVDTRITVPPHCSASAEVQILEEQMNCNFRLLTTMHGRLRVVFQDSGHDNAFLKYVEGDLGNIFEKILSQRPSFQDQTNNVKPHVWTEPHKCGQRILYIETWGKCQFRFGVHQNVESKLIEPFNWKMVSSYQGNLEVWVKEQQCFGEENRPSVGNRLTRHLRCKLTCSNRVHQ